MSGPRKAAPREKAVQFQDARYRVLHPSYINGSLHARGAEVQLPKGVTAGANLELIEEEKPAKEPAAGAKK